MCKTLITLINIIIFLTGILGCNSQQFSKEMLYVGTYSGRGSEGLYVFEFDRKEKRLTEIQTVSEFESPNFQTIHPNGQYLYSVSSASFDDDTGHGTVVAYKIDQQTGKLTQINEQSAEGRGPCHISIDPKGRFAYVSNFGEGNLSVYKIHDNGGLSEAVDVVQHEGSSIDERRQAGPHVHSIIPSTDGRFIYASDMGIDKVMIYEVDQKTGGLSPAEKPFVKVTPGAGPRHFTIHSNDQFAYSLGQMGGVVTAFAIDPSNGALSKMQEISMLPPGFDEGNQAADIHISPDGRFLYASNRGHNSLAIYKIHKTNGQLSLIGHEPTQGEHPRNFMIDQKGDFVIVANRDDDNLVLFQRDQSTGKLNFTGREFKVPMAVCVTQLIINE